MSSGASTLALAQSDSLQFSDLRSEGGIAMQEVVVTGTRHATDVRHLPMTVTVIDRNVLTEQHRANVLPTAMQQVPSLFVTSRSMMGYGVSTGAAGSINFRGISSGSGQMLVLVDGHPQYNGVYGHSLGDSYLSLIADRVEVLRGPASVLYGSNAMGGVLNIVTRQARHDGINTIVDLSAGSYGTVQAEASSQLRSGRFSSTVAAQYGRSDNHRPNMGFEQYGGFLRLGYDAGDHWKVSLTGNLTHWRASNPGLTTQPKLENDQWITRGEVSVAVENHYEQTSGGLSLYDNFGRHKINDGYNAVGGVPQTDLFRSKDAVAGMSWYQSAQLFEGNRITVGVDYQHIYGRAYYTNRETGDIVTTRQRLMQSAHAHENEVAGYVDFRQDLTSWLTIDAGLRYDHHSTAGAEWVPQMGIVWRALRTAELKASASKGFRNPTTREMYLYGTANHDSLRAERLWNYELSWRHRFEDITYGVNLFYIKGDNLIQTVAGRNINTGEMENYGLEVELHYTLLRNLSVTYNGALLHMKNPVIGSPKQKSYLGLDYRNKKLTVNLGCQFIRNLYTAVGAAEQKETFNLLSLTTTYDLTKNLSLWIRGENLLAESYEINQGYPMPRATVMGGFHVNF